MDDFSDITKEASANPGELQYNKQGTQHYFSIQIQGLLFSACGPDYLLAYNALWKSVSEHPEIRKVGM